MLWPRCLVESPARLPPRRGWLGRQDRLDTRDFKLMRCPFCNTDKDKVIDSRSSEAGKVIRRRRECIQCSRRFTTYERVVDTARLTVIKRDGRRVPYDRDKILTGVQKACYKRPVETALLDKLVDEVDQEVFKTADREISSTLIGQLIAVKLRKLDQVAYVRFASVYHKFSDVGEFVEEVRNIQSTPEESDGQRKLFEQ